MRALAVNERIDSNVRSTVRTVTIIVSPTEARLIKSPISTLLSDRRESHDLREAARPDVTANARKYSSSVPRYSIPCDFNSLCCLK